MTKSTLSVCPVTEWLNANCDWVSEKYGGQYVAHCATGEIVDSANSFSELIDKIREDWAAERMTVNYIQPPGVIPMGGGVLFTPGEPD